MNMNEKENEMEEQIEGQQVMPGLELPDPIRPTTGASDKTTGWIVGVGAACVIALVAGVTFVAYRASQESSFCKAFDDWNEATSRMAYGSSDSQVLAAANDAEDALVRMRKAEPELESEIRQLEASIRLARVGESSNIEEPALLVAIWGNDECGDK